MTFIQAITSSSTVNGESSEVFPNPADSIRNEIHVKLITSDIIPAQFEVLVTKYPITVKVTVNFSTSTLLISKLQERLS